MAYPPNPVRAHFLEREHLEMAFARPTFGEVNQPILIDPIPGELALYQIISYLSVGLPIPQLAFRYH